MLYELVKKLINEHRLFASDMQNMESLVRSSEIDINQLSKLLSELRYKLSNHIIDEESVLFPEMAYNNLVDTSLLSEVMQQHLDILDRLDKLELELGAKNLENFKEILKDLQEILNIHHKSEETKIFPNVKESL
jgi:iron-sulfur cluster repair protein YtfE (RIC family)